MTLRPLALAALLLLAPVPGAAHAAETALPPATGEIGRASCRERV